MTNITADLCVIGAGSGGLTVAAGASQMGANVVLIEQGKMGGDCLNTGCVPSKSLLAAAKRAQSMRTSEPFGVAQHEPSVEYDKIKNHIRQVISTIAPHDSVERFEQLGVKVIKTYARFVSPREVTAGEHHITAKRYVIATGSSPAVPPIPGLDTVSFLTNETIFDLDRPPKHLIVIGGGPIGCELAQAHLLLGTRVTVLEMFSILPKDDSESVDIVRQQLLKNGLQLYENIKVNMVETNDSGIIATIEKDGKEKQIEGSHLLVAAGRTPNLNNLDLEKAGVNYTKRGILVDRCLRTSNRQIFAIGDVIGEYQFTHAASYHASIVIRNALFHLPAKVNYRVMPWVTYTLPELAHVGLNEAVAKQKKIAHVVLQTPFSENDRAQTEHDTNGMIKVLVTPRGKILGVTIVGSEAGELLAPWILAMKSNLKIDAMARMLAPYPTRSDISRQVASEFYKPKLYSKRMQKLVQFLTKF